jgi:hypothetical protein
MAVISCKRLLQGVKVLLRKTIFAGIQCLLCADLNGVIRALGFAGTDKSAFLFL